MAKALQGIFKAQLPDYFILVARFLLGWTFLRYGYGKLADEQFGVTAAELATPLKDLSLHRLSWYLFDHQPFKAFIGISQIICGGLLIVNRTAILGAFLFLPIVVNILVIDLTVMPPDHAVGFAWRLSFYVLLDLLVLWHYRSRMKIVWRAVQRNVSTGSRFPIWAYLILPALAIALDVLLVVPKLLINLALYPAATWDALATIPDILLKTWSRFFG